MNFYEQELRRMFLCKPPFCETQFTGKTMLSKLDDDLRVKIQFDSTFIKDHNDALFATIISRTEGVIDRQTFKFADIIGKVPFRGDKIDPYIWECGDSTDWYGYKINNSERAKIAKTVIGYLSMYRGKELTGSMQNQTPLYIHPATYARDHWEMEEYRASRKACLACKDLIEKEITENYCENRLDPLAVAAVLTKFRSEQVVYVLANTIRHKDWDGRFSSDNKDWAKRVAIYDDIDSFGDDRTRQFVIDKQHPCLVNLFVSQLRMELDMAKPSVLESLAQGMQQPPTEKTPARKDPER